MLLYEMIYYVIMCLYGKYLQDVNTRILYIFALFLPQTTRG